MGHTHGRPRSRGRATAATFTKLLTEARLAASGLLARALPASHEIVPNKVVLANGPGGPYGCNPKYIAEALLEHAAVPLDLVWLGRRHDHSIPSAIRQVPYATPAAAREMQSARVWVFNSRARRHVAKRPGQFYLQTWHGALSPKHVEADVPGLSRTYIEGAKLDSREADLLIANNDSYEGVLKRSFWYDGSILRCGMPRNAPLVHPNPREAERVRAQLGVPAGAGLCLYAPTFRDAGRLPLDALDPNLLCQALEARWGKPFVFAWRLHPNDVQRLNVAGLLHGIDASGFADVQLLLAATDVVVSDYSSILEDFALTGRPGYTFAPDLDDFRTQRGFYYNLDERPFPLAHTFEQLVDAVLDTTQEDFARMHEEFMERFGMHDDGDGAQVVAQLIEQVVIRGAQGTCLHPAGG